MAGPTTIETVQIEVTINRASQRRTDAALERMEKGGDRLKRGFERAGRTIGERLSRGADAGRAALKRLGDAGADAGGRVVRRMADAAKSIAGVNKEVDGTEKAAGRLRRALGSIGTGITLGIGNKIAGIATGLLGDAITAPERIRAQADAAAKSANLSVEEYGRLKHAAELSGASIEIVDKATRKMTSILGKKQPPEVAQALSTLGLSSERLKKARPEEALGAIGDALKKIPDDAERVRLSALLLGEEFGPKLTPLLEAGTAGIKAMGDEAEQLGLVFSKDTASAAERLGDANDKLKKRFEGVLNTVAAKYIPLMADLTEGVVDWIKANKDVIDGTLQKALDAVADAGRKAWAFLSQVDWGAVWDKVTAFADAVWSVAKAIYGMVDAFGAGNVALATMGLKVAAMLGPYGALAAAAVAAGYAIGSAFSKANVHLEKTLQRVYQVRAAAADESIKELEADEADFRATRERADRIENRLNNAARTIGGGKISDKHRSQIARLKAIAQDRGASEEQRQRVKYALISLEKAAENQQRKASTKAFGPKGKGGPVAATAFSGAVDSAIKEQADRAAYDAAARVAASGGSLKAQEKAAREAARARTEQLQQDPGFSQRVLADEARKRQQAALEGRATGVFGAVGGAEAVRLDVGAGAGGVPPLVVNTTKVEVAPGAVVISGNEFAADMPSLERALDRTLAARLGEEVGRAISTRRTPLLG